MSGKILAYLLVFALGLQNGGLAAASHQHFGFGSGGIHVSADGDHAEAAARIVSIYAADPACEKMPAGHCSDLGVIKPQIVWSRSRAWMTREHWPPHDLLLYGMATEAETPPPRT